MILAQVVGGYSIIQLLIIVIVIAACVGITMVVLRQAGITIPPFILTIAWIVLAAFVAIFAIRLVMSM